MSKIIYILLISAFISLLSACASDFNDYQGTANRAAMANVCYKNKLLSYSEFSAYSSFQLSSYPSQWVTDSNKLNNLYYRRVDSLNQQDWSSKRERLILECGHISTVAKRVGG